MPQNAPTSTKSLISTPTVKIDKFDNIKKDRFVEFYRRDEVRGNISMSCDAVMISRQTYYDWLDKDELFRKAIYDAKMRMCDDMEQVLIARAVEKDTTALIYWLKYNNPTYKEAPANVMINEAKILVMPSQLIDKYKIESK
jgi:hypothetical protein